MLEITNTTSPPIAIKQRTETIQYNINNIRFDPTQNSPPSLWKMRLNKRVGNNNNNNNLKKTYKNINN